MKIQLLLEVETPDVARNAAAVQTDLRQLLLDSVQASLQRHPAFQVEIKTGDVSAKGTRRLLTKSDVAQHFGLSIRTLERWTRNKRLPEPIRVAAPHCTNGAPRWFPEDIRSARHD